MEPLLTLNFDPQQYTPQSITQAATVVNALSPLDFRGGRGAYAAALSRVTPTDATAFQCAMDAGDVLCPFITQLGSLYLSDFHVHVPTIYTWVIHATLWRSPMAPDIKNTVILIDATDWIEVADELLNNLHRDTGITIPPEMVLSDAVDVIVGFQTRRPSLESIDYFLMALEERDRFLSSDDPERACALLMEDKAADTIREVVDALSPYVEQVIQMEHKRRLSHRDQWIVYRLSYNRFAIEVGDGSRSIQNRHFNVPSDLQRSGRLEDCWVANPLAASSY